MERVVFTLLELEARETEGFEPLSRRRKILGRELFKRLLIF